MKLLRVAALAGSSLLLMAGARGTEVSQAQIAQFQPGVATLSDVEAKLGAPTKTGPSSGGGTAVDYILLDETPNAASAVPFARLAAGAMNLHESRVEFQFDASSHLVAVATSTRDLVCPHRACTADQLSQPWTPSPTEGD
jgi:hypothetical protein